MTRRPIVGCPAKDGDDKCKLVYISAHDVHFKDIFVPNTRSQHIIVIPNVVTDCYMTPFNELQVLLYDITREYDVTNADAIFWQPRLLGPTREELRRHQLVGGRTAGDTSRHRSIAAGRRQHVRRRPSNAETSKMVAQEAGHYRTSRSRDRYSHRHRFCQCWNVRQK